MKKKLMNLLFVDEQQGTDNQQIKETTATI
jgi:hypothetical protein